MRILMVCLGNICRSPIAEGVLRAKALQNNLDWKVASAGTESYHIGSPPHRFSQKVCHKFGIDISAQRARRFEPADFRKFDKIYAMSQDVLDIVRDMSGIHYQPDNINLFLNELYPGRNRSVPDPWYGPESGFTEVYELIDKTCEAIIRRYK